MYICPIQKEMGTIIGLLKKIKQVLILFQMPSLFIFNPSLFDDVFKRYQITETRIIELYAH